MEKKIKEMVESGFEKESFEGIEWGWFNEKV